MRYVPKSTENIRTKSQICSPRVSKTTECLYVLLTWKKNSNFAMQNFMQTWPRWHEKYADFTVKKYLVKNSDLKYSGKM